MMRFLRLTFFAFLISWASLHLDNRIFAAVRCNLKKDKDGTQQVLVPNLPAAFWQPSGALRKVRDGLALTLDRKVEFLDSTGKPLGEQQGRCRLVYDLWAEVFTLSDSIYNPTGEFKFSNAHGQDALEKCASIPLLTPTQNYSMLHVVTLVNPVDAKQEERTRTWLATKGIGGSGSGVIGRALGAVINLKTESVVDYDCTP